MIKKYFLPLLITSLTFGAEADHYTNSLEPLKDVADDINLKANYYLMKAIDETGKGCDENILYANLRKYFNNHSSGELVKDILNKNDISKRVIPLKESIYSDWNIGNGFLLGRSSAASSPLALSPMININSQVIGVDKLEHMFGMGFRYFTKHHLRNKSLKKALKGGIFKEKTILGGNILATGVFSYADLAANFNGMRFWNHVLLRRDDVIGRNLGPYVKCENDSFVFNQEIDFRNYIDASMDESINCNKFAVNRSVKKYNKALKARGLKYNVDFHCPMSMSKLDEVSQKYNVQLGKKTISHYIINDDGIEDLSYFNEF